MKTDMQEQEERQMVTFRKRWGLTHRGQVYEMSKNSFLRRKCKGKR
jgi:hypothetical protein